VDHRPIDNSSTTFFVLRRSFIVGFLGKLFEFIALLLHVARPHSLVVVLFVDPVPCNRGNIFGSHINGRYSRVPGAYNRIPFDILDNVCHIPPLPPLPPLLPLPPLSLSRPSSVSPTDLLEKNVFC
jgi:hypothetical protein